MSNYPVTTKEIVDKIFDLLLGKIKEVQNKIPKRLSQLESDIDVVYRDDLADWAKSPTKPVYSYAEVGAEPSGASNEALQRANQYTDSVADGLENAIDKKLNKSAISSWALANTKPSYNASEVNADEKGSANAALEDAKIYADNIKASIDTVMSEKDLSHKKYVDDTYEQVNTSLLDKLDKTSISSWALQDVKPSYTAVEIGADVQGSAASALEEAKSYTDKGLATKLDKSAISNWALQSSKPSYTAQEVGALSVGTHVGTTEGEKATLSDATEHMADESIHVSLEDKTKWNNYATQKVNSSDLADWVKQPNKPSYTYEEVGALPANTHVGTTQEEQNAISNSSIHINNNTLHVTSNDKTKWNGYEQTLASKLNTTDISDWAKSTVKPVYTYEEVGADSKGSAATALTQANSYTDGKIADLINGAPETLDTLKEVADAIQENRDVADALNAAIGNKADKSVVDTLSSSINVEALTSQEMENIWNDN